MFLYKKRIKRNDLKFDESKIVNCEFLIVF